MKHLFSNKVYFNEVDKGGVVFFANYLIYLDNARTTFFNDLGFGFSTQEKDNILFAVASLDIRYKNSLYLDDGYTVETRIENIKFMSIELHQTILRGQDIITSSVMKLAYLDFNNNQKVTKIPSNIRERLSRNE